MPDISENPLYSAAYSQFTDYIDDILTKKLPIQRITDDSLWYVDKTSTYMARFFINFYTGHFGAQHLAMPFTITLSFHENVITVSMATYCGIGNGNGVKTLGDTLTRHYSWSANLAEDQYRLEEIRSMLTDPIEKNLKESAKIFAKAAADFSIAMFGRRGIMRRIEDRDK